MKRLLTLFVLILFSLTSFAKANKRRVVVVGGGLAGLSAAIEAYRNKAEVLLLDKEPRIGGNSIKATSGMNAACTRPQESKKVSDAVPIFVEDTMKSGKCYSNKKLVEVLAKESCDAWQFLSDLGVDLDLVEQSGGHSVARTHRAEKQRGKCISNVGMDIIRALDTYIHNCMSQITVVNSAIVSELLKDDRGAIVGVKYHYGSGTRIALADAVILATGGYCGQTGDNSLLARYRPDLSKLSTTNGNCASGDGIGIACIAGASVVDMDKVQVHPTGFVNPQSPNDLRKFLAPESLRSSGGILLNHEGRRFVNELGKRDYVTDRILHSCRAYSVFDERGPISAYLVLNGAGAKLFKKKVLEFYQRRGFVQTVADADALALLIKTNPDVVRKTLKAYSASKAKGRDEFGKNVFPTDFGVDEPLYVMVVTPCLHYSMGGVKFNEQACVLSGNCPIKNLYAAGEVTGGLHGANRLCGNSLLECVVFGRIAGKNAAMQ